MFALRDDLHCCIANERAVFLDLVTNRYFCLPRQLDEAFQTVFMSGHGDDQTPDFKQLVRMGVLTRDSGQGAGTNAPPITPAMISIDLAVCKANPLAIVDALLCRRKAQRTVSTTPLNRLIAQVRAWKAAIGASPRCLDERVRNDIAAFAKSRRLHVSQDQCLASSLALLQFLRKRNVFPDLVIGAKMSPFAAHAWVQTGPVVLADDIDKVRLYTPILVV